jgi:hypothetical protein
MGWRKGTRKDEVIVHEILADFKTEKGGQEWFLPEPTVLELIEDLITDRPEVQP